MTFESWKRCNTGTLRGRTPDEAMLMAYMGGLFVGKALTGSVCGNPTEGRTMTDAELRKLAGCYWESHLDTLYDTGDRHIATEAYAAGFRAGEVEGVAAGRERVLDAAEGLPTTHTEYGSVVVMLKGDLIEQLKG